MLSKKIFIILFVIVIFSCSKDNNPQIPNSNSYFDSSLNFVGSNETLDIITWNIQNFPKNELTINYIKESIDSLNVDIIALQEIESLNALNELNQLLGDNWQTYKSFTSNYGNLAYLINTNSIQSFQSPYNILNEHSYNFASRTPYVLEFDYNNEHHILVNIHYKCCSNTAENPDNEDRRLASNQAIYNFINNNWNNDNVIIMGDFNDELVDNNNIFQVFLDNSNNYMFTDIEIAEGASQYWSFPSWPSHLDHILITNELFDNEIITTTVFLDLSLIGGLGTYDEIISDHRPMGISLDFSP